MKPWLLQTMVWFKRFSTPTEQEPAQKIIYGVEGYLRTMLRARGVLHIILLAKNQVGLKTQPLVSFSHLEHFYRAPAFPALY